MPMTRSELINELADEMINGMGWDELASLARNLLVREYEALSDEELFNDVKNCAPHLLDDEEF